MHREYIKKYLDHSEDYRDALFSRGYLISSNKEINYRVYPFYEKWKILKLGFVDIYTHPKQKVYHFNDKNLNVVMIGSAFNPFDNEIEENHIIRKLSRYYNDDEKFYNYVNELTGIFILFVLKDNKIKIIQDCSGMKSVFFGEISKNIYISSHAQLIADLLDLQLDINIKKLINSKAYMYSNRYLPGNMSPYKELKRLGGNTMLFYDKSFKIIRFWPIKSHPILQNDAEIEKVTYSIASILRTSLNLIVKKWKRPSISLSGGVDSKTTLASACNNYSDFSYYSYISKPQERVDSDAAHKICELLDLKHNIYEIPDRNEYYDDFDILKKIIDHNTSYFKKTVDYEIRKLIFFYKLNEFDVEVKSWASEIARVFLDRKYNMKMPAILNERHLSILQTRYFLTPRLLKLADKENYRFLREIGLEKPLYNYEHSDLYYWEIRMGGWGASVVNSFDLCHDVIMPFNNRCIIDMFLSIPREYRINDDVHKKIIEINNPKINKIEKVENLYFHAYRTLIEKIYFKYRTLFYIKRK